MLILKSNSNLIEGIRIESEHEDLYNYFEKYLKKNKLKMPIDKVGFYKMIVKVHIKEDSKYYSKLKLIEGD